MKHQYRVSNQSYAYVLVSCTCSQNTTILIRQMGSTCVLAFSLLLANDSRVAVNEYPALGVVSKYLVAKQWHVYSTNTMLSIREQVYMRAVVISHM